MTVPATTRKAGPFTGNGTQTVFPFAFKIFATTDVKVVVADTTGTESTLSSGFTVNMNADQVASPGGSVTLSTALATGYKLALLGNLPYDQTLAIPGGGNYNPVSHENALDRIVEQVQQVAEVGSRVLTLPVTAGGASTTLPSPAGSKFIGWNAAGTALENIDQSTLVTSVAYGTANSDIFSGDGVQTVFTLTNNPGTQANLDIDIGGVTQTAGIDFTWTSGTTVTFTVAPPSGVRIQARYMQALAQGTADAAATTVTDSGGWFSAVATKVVESVLGWIGSWIWGRDDNVFQYLSVSEIASVKAYSFSVDVTASVQNAINTAFANKRSLYCPAGGYLTTGLALPGSISPTDTRSRSFRIYGQGVGIPYSTLNNGGTVFKSTTDAPILSDPVVTLPNAVAEYEVDHIRFDGTSTTPVVLIHSLYGNSSVHHCVAYQRGTGDGFKFEYIVTGQVHANYTFNRDFVTATMGLSRVGIGFNFPQGYGGGLASIHHNSARGFLTAYYLGGNGSAPADDYSPEVAHNEASTVYNGFILTSDVNKAWVHHNYLEGGDQGIGIKNDSDYATIENNLIFAGFSKAIEDITTTNVGTVIAANTVSTGSVANAIGIDVQSSAAFGGNDKTVFGNSIIYTLGTAGVSGLKISGTDSRISHWGNMYSPRGGWTGSGTKEINDTSTGVYGFAEAYIGSRKVPVLSQGVIYLQSGASALTEANVATNILTVPEGSYYLCSATVAATVNRLSLSNSKSGRLITFRTTTANMSFVNSAYIKTAAAASFTGPGTITFLVENSGGSNFAYELARTVF